MAATITSALLTVRLTATKTVEESPRAHAPDSIFALSRGLAAGDERAFHEFHQRYFDRLYRFLLVVARGREDEAQEALQQTFLRVLRYAREFDSEEAFWCWLKVLARSATRDAARKQHRYLALLQAFALRWNAPIEPAPFEEDYLEQALQECLEELDPAERQLVQGKYVDGLTVKELAAQAGLTGKAVESRLLRLRQQLRQRTLEKLRAL
ncbi:MAG TPA: sigma-70 family RNA polymerase sigma factor [Candidatus Acidoferrum sp.]|nr:sigma-70 family RNA polymerase sigma factor [Candidatus Acidoferrum sp.]